jgi:quercetin dioxygenase-like cupin family protein
MRTPSSPRLHRFVPFVLLITFLCPGSFRAAESATNPAQKSTADSALSVKTLLTQALRDAELSGFEVRIAELTVKPGANDSKAHRHDADLFVYVQHGAIQTTFERGAPLTFKAGEVFHEPRNILHTSLRNLSATEPARLLLFYVIKKGRATYTAEPHADHK